MRIYIRKYLCLAALSFCALTAHSGERDALTKKHISYGNAALEEADYKSAVEYYEKALSEDPNSKSVMYSLGVLYIQTGDTGKAGELFMNYLERFPLDVDGLFGLSNVYILEGEYEKACRLLTQAASQDKKNEALRRNLGYAQLQSGYVQAAKKTLLDLTAEFPSNRLTRFDLALAYAADKDYPNALKQVKAGLLMSPDAEGKLIYGDLLDLAGGALLEEAVEDFRKNEMEKAIAILEPLCNQYPDYARAQAYLGHACNLKFPPDREKAEKAYRAALQASRFVPVSQQDFAVIYDNLGSIVLRKGNLEEAESYYRSGIAQESDYAPVYFNFGLLRAHKGAFTEASVALMDAVRRDPHMESYIASHPKLAAFRSSVDYTNLVNTIKKEIAKDEQSKD
ncbi:tetratricopeptide repeat protein [bacterium]|nr:tetratricopeptide repeat protein [bacterium]